MQISRLFEIVYLLLQRGKVTASELAERFEVSTRTVYRDVDALSQAGIPVYCNRGKGGGICLLPNFVLDKSLLTEQEQNEILFALQSLQVANTGDGQALLSRLNGLFQKGGSDWIDVDFSHWGGGEAEQKKFRALKAGILEHRRISFGYYSSYGRHTQRVVEPARLCFKDSRWYLQAFCLEKNAYRTFKICRMQQVCLTEVHFEPHKEPLPSLDGEPAGPSEIVMLELVFSSHLAFRIYDEFEPSQIETTPDGNFLVTVFYPNGDWIYSFLLSFGEDVKVVSPAFVQEGLCKKAKQIQKIYADLG